MTVSRNGNGAIITSSNNTNIATASVNGNIVTVTPHAVGSATISVSVGATDLYASSMEYILVEVEKAANNVVLSSNSMTLDSSNLSGTVTVSRLGTGEISAASSDPSVATVSVSGTTVTITAEGNGEATITVTVAGTSTHLFGTATIAVTCNLIDSTMENNSTANIIAAIQAGKGRDISGM